MKYSKTLILIITILQTTMTYARIVIPSKEQAVRKFGHAGKLSTSENFTFLVWNIYKGKKKSWANQMRNLQYTSDIILIQEFVDSEKVLSTVNDFQGFETIMATSFIDLRKKQQTGVATLSRIKSSKSSYLKSKYTEPILKSPKVSLLTQYPVAGSDLTLMVINIHGINFVRAFALEDQLNEIAIKVNAHTGPLILAGDFNTWTRAKMNILVSITKRLKLDTVKFKKDFRKKMFGHPLDHIFTRGITVEHSEVLESFSGSDHLPMYIRARIN